MKEIEENLGTSETENTLKINTAFSINNFTGLHIRIGSSDFKYNIQKAKENPNIKTIKEIVFDIDGIETEITLDQLQSFLAMFYRAENEKEITID